MSSVSLAPLSGRLFTPPFPDESQSLDEDAARDDASRTSLTPSITQAIQVTRRFHLSKWELILHAGSIVFTTAVLYLCATEVYFEDITKPNINTILNTFQFVAALYSVMIDISDGAIVVYYLKYELYRGTGLRAGLLLAPFQIGSLQMLFERHFWKAVFASRNTLRTYLFGAGISFLIVLQVLIAPSSAILIVPQLQWWEFDNPFGTTGGFSYLNQSHSTLWPRKITGAIVPSQCDGGKLYDIPPKCPYFKYTAITRWVSEYANQFADPNITALTTSNTLRYLGGNPYILDEKTNYSVASTGMNHVTRSLGDIWTFATRNKRVSMRHISRPKITVSSPDSSKPLMRPLVRTECSPAVDITDVDEMFEVTFPADQLRPSPGQSFAPTISQVVNITRYRTSSYPVAYFIDLSKTTSQPLTGALFGMKFSSAKDFSLERDEAVGLIACTLTAHWGPTFMSIDPNVDNVVMPDYPNPLDIVNSPELMQRALGIDLEHSYTQRVNAPLKGLKVNVLEYEIAGILPHSNFSEPFDGSWNHRWSWVVATVLSMQMTDALARTKTVVASMYTYCYLCPDQTNTNYTGKSAIMNLANQNVAKDNIKTTISEADWASSIVNQPDLYTPVQWTVQRYGYGWSLKGTTAVLAAVVLLIQASVLMGYLLARMAWRWPFEGWDSLWELVALLHKSPNIPELSELAIGKSASKAYETPLAIREDSDGEHAVLTKDTDSRMLRIGTNYG
ncbi:hypothetical protein CLAIMM_11437 [Cladophialophora immunda]|nr:hypothetical protein CLAIMM_11437 [Cladophialophora immunda]